MGQRVGDLQQVGARHQLLADAFLQRDEDVPHALELVLQLLGCAAELPAGVHDGQGEVVPDVRVDPREGELEGPYARMAAELEQRPPARGHRPPLGHPEIPLGEADVQRARAPPVRELPGVDAPAELLGDREIDAVEHRHPVPLRPDHAERAHTDHDATDAGHGLLQPHHARSVPGPHRPGAPGRGHSPERGTRGVGRAGEGSTAAAGRRGRTPCPVSPPPPSEDLVRLAWLREGHHHHRRCPVHPHQDRIDLLPRHGRGQAVRRHHPRRQGHRLDGHVRHRRRSLGRHDA